VKKFHNFWDVVNGAEFIKDKDKKRDLVKVEQ
jgi:hypothetical protein